MAELPPDRIIKWGNTFPAYRCRLISAASEGDTGAYEYPAGSGNFVVPVPGNAFASLTLLIKATTAGIVDEDTFTGMDVEDDDAVVGDETCGWLTYQWQPNDTKHTPDMYHTEVRGVLLDGNVWTFPSGDVDVEHSYNHLLIRASLEDGS